jgi:transcriptional regulator with XRE-family HTH domain
MHLGRNLELLHAIAASGLNCREVAGRVSVSAQALSAYVNRRAVPRRKTALKLAHVLKVNVNVLDLYGGNAEVRR